MPCRELGRWKWLAINILAPICSTCQPNAHQLPSPRQDLCLLLLRGNPLLNIIAFMYRYIENNLYSELSSITGNAAYKSIGLLWF